MAKKKKSATKKSASAKAAELPDSQTFEEAIEQLREIVNQLENGNLTLTESLEKYEQGVGNLRNCYQALDEVQKQIELLVDLDENGNLTCRPFDDRATHQAGASLKNNKTSQESSPQRPPTADEVDFLSYDEDDNGDDHDIDDPNSLF